MLTSSLPPVGMQKCGNCDSSEVSLIADTLLKNLCIIVVEKNARDPFGSAQVKAEEVRRSIMEHINRMSNDYFKKHVVSSQSEKSSDPVKPSATVEDMLESYVSGSRNLLTQLSTRIVLGDKKEEVVKQVYDDLEKLGFWVLAKREAVARVLIERVDTEKVAHCSELFTLDDEDAYSLHQEQCKFAPFECVNIGCGKVNSLMYAAAHDEVCPRKLVPCSQDCGLEIAREDMKTHTLTVCNKKPVPCPFKSIGCNEPLVQGELLEHCRTWVERHLFSTFTAHQEAVATVNDQGRQLSLMQKVETLILWGFLWLGLVHVFLPSFFPFFMSDSGRMAAQTRLGTPDNEEFS